MPAITSETSLLLLTTPPTPETTTTATATTLLLPATAISNASSNSASPYPDPLERRLQLDTASGGGGWLPALPRLAPIVLSNLLPTYNGSQTTPGAAITATTSSSIATTSSSIATTSSSSIATTTTSSIGIGHRIASTFATFRPPSIENLVASSAEDLSNFRDVSFDIFDEDDDLFGSPLAFDASEHGLWNGRFVPPPPRPPFFVDEPVLSDGLTTCDLCSWAMPTKSTFIFEGTIEKASELGWPLTLIIVSILSALLGAIVMITVVRCRRKKASNNRNGKCPLSLKVASANPRPQHHHPPHQQHPHQQHPNHHYNHNHHDFHHDFHHDHQQHHHLNHHHHPYQHPQQQQHALHAQFPLHSHHTAYSPHRTGPQPPPPWQRPQQQQQQYASNSCSSSSLTNDSNSTKRTSLSTIYRPPSYCHGSLAPKVLHNGQAPALLLAKGLDMLTRSLPPPPPPSDRRRDNDADSDADADCDCDSHSDSVRSGLNESSSLCSSRTSPLGGPRADEALYEEPALAADVAAAAVMVAAAPAD